MMPKEQVPGSPQRIPPSRSRHDQGSRNQKPEARNPKKVAGYTNTSVSYVMVARNIGNKKGAAVSNQKKQETRI
jgi:hypothetical protein